MGVRGRAVAALVVPTIAVILGVVALTGFADATSHRSQAESSFEVSARAATDARSDAMRSRLLLLRAVDEATAFATEASTLVTSADGLLDAAALEALTGALSKLNAAMPTSPSVPELPPLAPSSDTAELAEGAITLDSWTATARGIADQLDSELTAVDALVQAAQTSLARVASAAAPAGATLLADTAMASAESRADLETSLEAVSTRLGAGATPMIELSSYLEAAKAARASHAAAVAAAAAASAQGESAGGGGSRQLVGFPDLCTIIECPDLNNPPIVNFYDNYVGAFCPQDPVYREQYSPQNGETFEIFPDYPGQPYGGRLLAFAHGWALLLEFCA